MLKSHIHTLPSRGASLQGSPPAGPGGDCGPEEAPGAAARIPFDTYNTQFVSSYTGRYLAQLDRAGLGRNTFSPEALALIVRSAEGLLRRTRNLCLSALIEAVRDQVRAVDLKQVNRVLGRLPKNPVTPVRSKLSRQKDS